MNKVILRGHLGADPIFNTTNTNQKPVCNFRMATNKTYKDANQQVVKTAEWHNVVCWNRLAETVRDYCHKSSNVLVEAELRTREFMGQVKDANGNVICDTTGQPILVKRYTTECVAKSVEFLDKAPTTTAYPNGGVAATVAAGAAPAAVVVQPAAGAVVQNTAGVAVPPATQTVVYVDAAGNRVNPPPGATFVQAPPVETVQEITIGAGV